MCIRENSCVSDDVLSYLTAHQDAQDTLEGIVEWWLMEQKIVNQTARVRDALGELVADGLLLARRGKDARTHYRINRKRTREIVARIGQRPEQT